MYIINVFSTKTYEKPCIRLSIINYSLKKKLKKKMKIENVYKLLK